MNYFYENCCNLIIFQNKEAYIPEIYNAMYLLTWPRFTDEHKWQFICHYMQQYVEFIVFCNVRKLFKVVGFIGQSEGESKRNTITIKVCNKRQQHQLP